MDAAAYVSALQGRPWTTTNHCWALVLEVQRDLFGRVLPPFLIDGRLTARELVAAFHGHEERRNWRQVAVPSDGAVVLMHRPGSPSRAIHTGVYLALEGGGVLHADEQAGVTFDGSADLLVRGWRAEFFLPL